MATQTDHETWIETHDYRGEYAPLTATATMPQTTATRPSRRPVASILAIGGVLLALACFGALWGVCGHGGQVAGEDAEGAAAYWASKPCDPATASRTIIVRNQTVILRPGKQAPK